MVFDQARLRYINPSCYGSSIVRIQAARRVRKAAMEIASSTESVTCGGGGGRPLRT